MNNVLDVAKCFYDCYLRKFRKNLDELKMHKLMYLVQRESLLVHDKPLFSENFFGWKYGPVLKKVREEYRAEEPFKNVESTTDPEVLELVQAVLDRYGDLPSWDLSNLSHQELSWRKTREGLDPEENGNKKLSLDMMRVDAVREKLKRAHYGL